MHMAPHPLGEEKNTETARGVTAVFKNCCFDLLLMTLPFQDTDV
jgi:hypothetical protein